MPSKPKITILNVDDNDAARYVISRILRKAGFEVKEAATGRDALRLVKENPDLIILDVNLPDMNGFEVCQRIKADPTGASIPVLHVSATYVQSEAKIKGLESGADGYLAQSVEPAELIATVKALLRTRQAEETARALAQQWQVTFDAISDGVCLLDLEGRVVRCNKSATNFLKKPSDEILAGAIHELVYSKLDALERNPFLRMRESRRREVVDLRIGDQWFHIMVDPLLDESGNLVGAVHIMNDITERKRTEEALRLHKLELEVQNRELMETQIQLEESRNKYSDLYDFAPLGYFTFDKNGVILEVNLTGANQLGKERRFLIGKPFSSYIVEGYKDVFRYHCAQVFESQTRQICEIEILNKRRGIQFHARLESVPVQDSSGGSVCRTSLSDITERKRAEEERARLLARERAARAEAEAAARKLREADRRKDEFLAMLGHELRNPLAPILTAVQVMRLRGVEDPETLKRAMEVVERQVRYQARLIDDLLDVSRITRGKIELQKEPVELATVVAHAVETSRPLIEARRHALSVSLPQEPVWLEADPIRLEQVLANLLNNAAKYTEPGGRIWLTGTREGNEIVLKVRDTGIGISPEMLSQVFDLFIQADQSLARSQGGLGIGLTLARSLVEMHGGRISAYSAGLGQGSEFTVRLPLMPKGQGRDEAGRQKARESSGVLSSPRRILVVDDNVDAARTLGELLELWGHQVRVVHDGPTAIETARSYRPEVVLLDIGLPKMDGYEVARRLRQLPGLSGMVLVALTGYGQEEDQNRAREAGFDYHFTKPVDLADLRKLLVHGSRHLS